MTLAVMSHFPLGLHPPHSRPLASRRGRTAFHILGLGISEGRWTAVVLLIRLEWTKWVPCGGDSGYLLLSLQNARVTRGRGLGIRYP